MFSSLNITTLDQCGQGSYGKVLMAYANELDMPLAIKKVSKANSLIFPSCLDQEARYGFDGERDHPEVELQELQRVPNYSNASKCWYLLRR